MQEQLLLESHLRQLHLPALLAHYRSLAEDAARCSQRQQVSQVPWQSRRYSKESRTPSSGASGPFASQCKRSWPTSTSPCCAESIELK